jgi:uncharacterized protein YceH (UPF0502 family)
LVAFTSRFGKNLGAGIITFMSEVSPVRSWVPLTPRERRVLGVLVEKQKTTPEYYPMSVAALVSGCNQKSNRDPVTNYDADDVEEILHGLRQKGAAILVEGSGRVVRWKHTLYDWLDLKNRPVEMAVLAELMLRGPQTEGDLRARASRMEPLQDLGALQTVLGYLASRELVVYLSPPGQRRGVVVTHGLYPEEELEPVRRKHSQSVVEDEHEAPVASSRGGSSGWATEAEAIRAEIEALRAKVQTLAAEVEGLKSALGA